MLWFKIKEAAGRKEVFDPVRKKYVTLTPEEEVRQLTLQMLVEKLHVPMGLIAVEHAIKLNGLDKRCDIVVFSKTAKPLMIVECKARHIPINQQTLEQAARYNFNLKVSYLLLTNGKDYYCYYINTKDQLIKQLEIIPDFTEMQLANKTAI